MWNSSLFRDAILPANLHLPEALYPPITTALARRQVCLWGAFQIKKNQILNTATLWEVVERGDGNKLIVKAMLLGEISQPLIFTFFPFLNTVVLALPLCLPGHAGLNSPNDQSVTSGLLYLQGLKSGLPQIHRNSKVTPQLELSAHPISFSFSPLLSPNPACSESLSTKKRCQKAQFYIFGDYGNFLPCCYQQPKSPPNPELLLMLGHKPSMWWTYHHPLPTTCKVSLLQFRGEVSLVLISGTGEFPQELLRSNKPVAILFQFGLI